MDTLPLKPRRPVEEEIESWDDGDFMMDGQDITMRSTSTTANAPSRRRDSNSSHLSLRSEIESWAGEEEKHVHVPGDDEKSTLGAISAAQNAGIPLPKNVPSSALMGGTIKRLGGGRRWRKITHEDWENDLELPDAAQGLKIKPHDQAGFPETLRQVSGGSVQASPTKNAKPPSVPFQDDRGDSGRLSFGTQSTSINLDKFKDADDDDFFGDGCDTIKVSKRQSTTKPVSLVTPPTPQKQEPTKQPEDDFEKDLELPSNGTLQLSSRRDIPKTPSSQADDDWGEGSLGTRFGGTRRDGRSNRSSSVSALSPSVSSSITAESEDETFDGLVLPPGPVNFQERLQHRRKSRSPERIPEEPSPPKKSTPAEADRPGFLDGLEIGDGDVFNSGKLTLHRNIKVKDGRPSSPARPKTSVSLTFSNKPSGSTRIPRLSHERTHSTSLEPVSESGGPIPQRARRPQSRLGHSAQSSVTSIPTPTTPSSTHQWSPSTPSNRRELGAKTSTPSLRNEPTTTNAQLLKQKRSLPAIRALNPAAKPPSFRNDRPPSRTDSRRPQSGMRPKTPVDCQRQGSESPAQPRKGHLPFLPAGASHTQSQHATSKAVRQFRRHDSDNSIDLRPNSRTGSRSVMRSPSPHRYRVAADTWERLSRPKGKKNFGDGHELDGFDDLPTSKETETRFMKQPSSSNAKPALRNKALQNIAPDRTSTPTPTSSHPTKTSSMPHFARDTTASRIARETSLAHRSTSSTGGPLAQINAQRGTPLASRVNVNTQHLQQPTIRSKKSSKRPPQLKPHLISNLNSGKESKMINGMTYNPDTFRWEGNENALNIFDAAASTPTTTTTPLVNKERETPPPRPALITNFSATKGIQVVNGMVFDPESMCWLKLGAQQSAKSDTSDPLDKFNALEDDDVFKDIPDLEENPGDEEGKPGRVSDINDDWLVGEEFDVGPEFVRRQREEEERWRKKCEKWAGRGVRDREAWRWTIRELVSQFDDLPM